MTEREAAALAELATGKTVLELGTHLGRSAIAMATTARMVHTVDWHRGDESMGPKDSLVEFWQNLKDSEYRDRITAHVGRFEHVLPLFPTGWFDMVFVDGGHSKNSVIHDLQDAHRHLRVGGVLAIHDWGRFDVREAYDAWEALDGHTMTFDRQVESLYVARWIP